MTNTKYNIHIRNIIKLGNKNQGTIYFYYPLTKNTYYYLFSYSLPGIKSTLPTIRIFILAYNIEIKNNFSVGLVCMLSISKAQLKFNS
jgi:hypothetical protein